ncbi:CSE2-domain-containing protein [Annulohypoxylon truncatum]|uniref:CSE2-domain-containing protein n=1 Tax=Annulohypoxylon truncatum TaxID=327061 RepID=UPI0020071FEF|nr:CSE2-domain-containing protein [Annulohypoxylon truncatum]KAI1205690.1 CSE2-domain-containing protein [Annulohypoxylon truncatum]
MYFQAQNYLVHHLDHHLAPNPRACVMGDRLTQLQDAVDQLAQQFVASIHYINRHHNLETLGPGDQIRDVKQEQDELDPHPEDVFKASQLELAQDLITKEQQIELLISILPGLDNSEQDQERNIKELEEELKVAEAQRQEAIKEKEDTMVKLDAVIRSIRRP